MRQLRVTVTLVRRQRLFVPEAAKLLIDTPAAQRFIAIENLVGVHHDAPLLAAKLVGRADARISSSSGRGRP